MPDTRRRNRPRDRLGRVVDVVEVI
jgi:hypothetical protein